MASYEMNVQAREKTGSNKVNKLRTEKLIPGVLYKKGDETRTVQVEKLEFEGVFRYAGTTSIVNLDFDGETHPVIIKDVQRDPVKNEVLHVDFQEFNMDETLRIQIPINILNRDSIKIQPSVLTQVLNEVEVECLPSNIPNTADVDVADIDFTTPRFISDLDIAKDEDIEILEDLDTVVCTLTEPDEEEEEELDELDEEVDAGDVPVVGEEDEDEEDEEGEEEEE